MFKKKLKSDKKYYWTEHSKFKMCQYGLSSQRVVRVIRNPQRMEIGIVENTIAVMQPASVKYKNFKKTWSSEIWVMYQIKNQKSRVKSQNDNAKFKVPNSTNHKIYIISTWRYPGVSPKNNPIPKEILEEIQGSLR